MTELNPVGKGWDGSINGQKLPSDDYWFSATLQDNKVFKGHFTLKQ
ncbi:T9SS type B sorting domain-containing protein [Polaribacter filamentus]|nr:T9SS type B sorting domain-containing protein [Polaribacter filamentus]